MEQNRTYPHTILYGIELPFIIGEFFTKHEKKDNVVYKITKEYELGFLIKNDEINNKSIIAITFPLFNYKKYLNVTKLDYIELNNLTETNNFKNAIGCLFEVVLDIWKKYELENEKNKEILLPETLEFDWFICD